MDCKTRVFSKYWCICIAPEKKTKLNCWRYSHGYAAKRNQLLLTSKCFLCAHSQYWFLQVLNTKVVFGVQFSQVSSCLVLDKHYQFTSEHFSTDAFNVYRDIQLHSSSVRWDLGSCAAQQENSPEGKSLTLGAQEHIPRNHRISKQYLENAC